MSVDETQLRALLVGAKSAVRSLQCTGMSRFRDVPAGVQGRESAWAVWQVSDGRYRVERTEGTAIFDGRDNWLVSPDGTQAFKNPVPLPSLLKDAINPEWLQPGVALTDLGGCDLAGRTCRAVDARIPDGSLRYSLTVDQQTGLILKSRDEHTGLEFELDDVVVNGDIDDSRFRPPLGQGNTALVPSKRPSSLAMLAKAGVRRCFRR